MNEFVRRDEFSKDEYAALGQLLVAVTHLDDVLGRSTVKLISSSSSNLDAGSVDKVMAKAADISGKRRLTKFKEELQRSGTEHEWFKPLEDSAENIVKWRHALCHGRYSRGSCGAMRIEFFSHHSIKNSTVHPENCLTVEEANALSNEANSMSFEIHNRLITQ